MDIQKLLLDRHKKIDDKLKALWKKISDKNKGSMYVIASRIGGDLGKTSQTIINHCNGVGKDGYLKEIIFDELKKVK